MKTGGFVLLALVVLLVGSLPLSTAAAPIDLVYYIGTDQHVHELRFNGTRWTTTDLMTVTGAPNAAAGSALTGHVCGTSDNIFYIATDQHFHELAFYGSPRTWHHSDPTALAGALDAATGSDLTSHVYGNSDNIYYIATDGHVHELAFYGSPATWHTLDATSRAGAPNPAPGSALSSEVYSNSERIYFIGVDQHVRLLSFDGTWRSSDPTALTGAPNASVGSALTSHVYGNSDNLWYIATDGHVHELAFYSNSWHTADITVLAAAPSPIAGSALSSNVEGIRDKVYHIAPDPHVHQLWFNGVSTWGSVNVTAQAGAPRPDEESTLASHVYWNAENVFYLAEDQHVHELAFYSNSWHHSDPTASAGAPYAAVGSDLIGFVGL